MAIPLALYVHIPWCVRKCPYCDFNSHVPGADSESAAEPPEARYVEALLRDLESELPLVWGRRVGSVFIGGGTPSLFSAAAIGQLLQGIRARLPLTARAEVTLEANPGTAEAARFAGYREAGVDRLSIGVQSFQDRYLDALGRIHDGEQARDALAIARRAGFERTNLDLMFGLPGQSDEDAVADLDTALALNPGHLSWYQLTLEPNTLFHSQPPALPADEAMEAMVERGLARLQQAGYERYEVSAFALAGQRCRHNLNYWEFGDYIGIGAGAHGKLTAPDGSVTRRWRQRHPRDYMAAAERGDAVSGQRILAPGDLALEFMMNALRLPGGVPTASFRERTGLDPAMLEPGLATARARGWLGADPGRLQPSGEGLRWLNDLLELFVPD